MKVPMPRQLASGLWNVQVMLDGERISITDKSFDVCYKKAKTLKINYQMGEGKEIPEDDTLTVYEAISAYIGSRSNVLSPSTIRGYQQIRDHRFQKIMDKRITSVKNWQSVINAEAGECSAKTLKNATGLLRSALMESGVDIGKIRLPQVVEKEHEFLDADQIRDFVAAIDGDMCECAALLALHSLRRSEILAITKRNIHDGNIYVRGSRVVGKDNKFVEKQTNKNSSSRRTVPILIPRLEELVADLPDGRLVTEDPETIRKHINRVCKQNGLPVVGIHGLRHSFCSLCYSLGISEAMCMRLGGWSDIQVMRKIYTHLSEKDMSSDVEKLRQFFSNKK